jgi:hypothetical protein
VPPDDVRGHRQDAVEGEGAPVRPLPPVRGGGLRFDRGLVARQDVAFAGVRLDGADQFPQPFHESGERACFDRVDPALPQRGNGDEPGAGEGLQVLGGLRLPQAGELGQLADGPRPLREELHDAPPRRVSQCCCDLVHEQKYSPLRIFLSRNILA